MAGFWKSTYGLCQATAKTTGKPCRQMAISPKGRCVWHGGLSVGPRSVEGRAATLRNLPRYKDTPQAELEEIAARMVEKSEKRYRYLRNEADRRRPK